MLERMFLKGAIPALEKGLSFTTARHRAIVNNIANADTVFHKAEDLPVGEFQDLLSRRIEDQRRDRVGIFRWKDSSRFGENERGGLEVRPERVRARDAARGVLRHDKNNVSVELEMAKLGKNSMYHSAYLDLLRKQFRMLDGVLAERVDA